MEAVRVVAEDGVALHVDRHAPPGRARGVALVLHGMMVDRRSMDRPAGSGLASTLASAGWVTWNADLRGHGRSDALDDWTYDDLVRQDLPALVAAARGEGGPVWLVGLSLGGHVGMAALGTGRVSLDGAVLLSCNVWRPGLEPSLRRRARKAAQMAVFQGLTRGAGRFPSRAVRMGPADEAPSYVADLCRFWDDDRWASRDGEDWTDALGRVEAPVLSVIGAGDTLMAHRVGAANWIAPVRTATFAVVGPGDCGLRHRPDHIGLGADPRCAGVWRWVAGFMG